MKFNYITIKKLVRISAVLLMACFVMFLKIDNAKADINSAINFTGKITNTNGTEIADGNYNVNFGLYASSTGSSAIWSENLTAVNRFSGDISNVNGEVYTYNNDSNEGTLRLGQYLTNSSATGSVLIIDYNTTENTITVASGSPVWIAGQSINNRPYVEGGVININLGSVSDLSGIDFYQKLYLEVVFNGETMQPRKVLTSVAQAFEAASIGGKAESELAGLLENEQIEGEWNFDNILNIATSSSDTTLTVAQNGSGNIAEFKYGATTSLTVLNDGRVQIGDYIFPADRTGASSGYVLKTDNSGNLYWDTDFAGSGGGSGLWASSTVIYQADTGYVVVLGDTGTTTNIANLTLEVEGVSWMDMVAINSQNEIRLYDSDNSNYLALRSPTAITNNYTLTFPTDSGSSGETLVLNASGDLIWSTPSSFTYVNPGVSGQISYYESDGSTLSATSSIYLSSNGYFGISTTSPSALLTIGNNNQFTVTSAGAVDATSLILDNALLVTDGGTGKNLWTQYAIPYLTDTSTFGEIEIGTSTYVLSVNASQNGYEWIEASSTGVVLSQEQVDDYVDALINDPDSVHSRINIVYDDDNNAMDFIVNQDLSLYSNATSSFFSTTSGDILDFAHGGTNQSSYIKGDILYAQEDNVLSKLAIGSSSEILMITGGLPSWASASSSGVGSDYLVGVDSGASADYIGDASTTGVIQTTAPLSYTDGGDFITLGIITDSIGNDQLEFDTGQNLTTASLPTFAGITVNGNIVISGEIDGVNISSASSTWDTAVSWEDHADAGYFALTTWYATTTDALSEGSNNLYWTNERFDTRLLATSSLAHIISLSGLSEIGTIATGTWNADVIGIAYGGTGATTATGARENLDLDEVYKFGINATGTNEYIWQSDGNGRGHWVDASSLGVEGKKSKFVGITTATTNGVFATGTLSGYVAANNICNFEYTGSHFCRTYDIIVSIEQDDISGWGNDTMSAWIAEGPPGYTSDSNDCGGWKDSADSVLGAYWKFNSTGGGAGWLIHCGNQLPLACCSWQ